MSKAQLTRMPIMLNRCRDDSHNIQLTGIKSSCSTSEYFNFEFSSSL